MYILVINPGSTSTKIALFDDEKEVYSANLQHSVSELKGFSQIFDQYEYRLGLIQDFLNQNNIDLKSLNAVVGRGGLVRPIPCGTYSVNDQMIEDLKSGIEGIHASNLGPVLAKGIADIAGIPAYIVDPVTVDEMEEVAKVTGMPDIHRQSRLHTLNQKAVARKVASQMGKKYEELNFIVCHLGTGTSIGAHKKGRVVDMCDARGEGPMSGDRSGGINSFLIMEMIYSQGFSHKEMIEKMYMKSGLMAHLGTKDVREIRKWIENGNEHAKLILDALIYQNAKEIGAQAAALSGKVDAVIITGGMAYDEYIIGKLTDMIEFIAPVIISPGEMEMEALALGALRVLKGQEASQEYLPK